MPGNAVVASVCLTLGALLLLSTTTESVPYSGHRLFTDLDNEPDSSVMLELLARLGQSIMRANELEKEEPRSGYESPVWPGLSSNRGVPMLVGFRRAQRGEKYVLPDVGLGRGFSGRQAAKHLLAMEMANDPDGPGRKRRTTTE